MRVVNLYVPNGHSVGSEKYDYKLGWLAALHGFLEAEMKTYDKLVVLGDFNIAPDDRDVYDADRWRERILCSTPEREAMNALVEAGYRDALRRFHDETGIFTWWDYRRRGFERGNRGLRIDHLLMSAPALERCEDVWVDVEMRAGTKPSDHAPVIATFA